VGSAYGSRTASMRVFGHSDQTACPSGRVVDPPHRERVARAPARSPGRAKSADEWGIPRAPDRPPHKSLNPGAPLVGTCPSSGDPSTVSHPTSAGEDSTPAGATTPFPDSVTERRLDGTLAITLLPTRVEERAAARHAADDAREVLGASGADPAAAAALAARLEESGRAEMRALNSGRSAMAYQEALPLREAAARAAPQDPEALRSLAASLLGLANALDDGGRESEARARFAEMIALRRRVAELLPQESLARLQLAHALWRVGLFEHELHYRPSAAGRAHHEESLALLDHPWPDFTSSYKALQLRCQNLEALAQDALSQGGDPGLAEALVLRLLPLARQVADAAPGVRRGEYPPAGLSVLSDRLAGQFGRPGAKLQLTREQIEDLQVDLAGGPLDPRLTTRLGELLLARSVLEREGAYRDQGMQLLEQAAAQWAEVALASPLEAGHREVLFKALERLRRAGGLSGASPPWRDPLGRLVASWREVVAAGSPPKGLREALGQALQWLGDPEAARWFAEARGEAERHAMEALLTAPGDHGRQDHVLDHQRRLAKEALDRGERAGARLVLASALEFWRDLAGRHPKASGTQRGVLHAQLALARLEVQLGRVAAALPLFEPAIQATRDEIAACGRGDQERPLLASLLAEVAAAAYATDPAGRRLERLREIAAIRLHILEAWGGSEASCRGASGTLYHLALAARRAGQEDEAEQARGRGHAAGTWFIENASCFRTPGGGRLYVCDARERWTWPPRPIGPVPTDEELGWLEEAFACQAPREGEHDVGTLV